MLIQPKMNPLLLDIPTEYSSERLLLHCYRPGDGAMYFQMLRANWNYLYEYLPHEFVGVQSADDVEVVLRRHIADWQLRNLFIFELWEKATGSFVVRRRMENVIGNICPSMPPNCPPISSKQ